MNRKEPPKPDWPKHWDRVVVLVRDPFDTLLAEFNRRVANASHTGFAPQEVFESKRWPNYVWKFSEEWKAFHEFFLEEYTKGEDLYILSFERLKKNLRAELNKLVKFLGAEPMTDAVGNCVIKERQGSHHRAKPEVDLKQYYNEVMSDHVGKLRFETFKKLGLPAKKNQ